MNEGALKHKVLKFATAIGCLEICLKKSSKQSVKKGEKLCNLTASWGGGR
jgi:hypothetical protein